MLYVLLHSIKRGEVLKETIENYSTRKQVSGIVLCCVGCLTNLNIRLADGKCTLEKARQFEIVSMTSTLSKDGVHIHIFVSDEFGNTIGGH